MSETPNSSPRKSVGVSELPIDELVHYGRQLGLDLDQKMGQGELLRRVRERQELLVELDREAMLDVVVWARRPVRASASKEELAEQIATIGRMKFKGLSDRGLIALARLRGVPVLSNTPRELIEAAMKDSEPLWQRVRRKRREVVGGLLDRMIAGRQEENVGDYRFLPEDKNAVSLKERIAENGFVGGIAHKLRGVADDYVREKLDEIETRIDRKLDEIDRRLGEWRDKEITNRLRIIKVTLVASVIVAILSLGYNYFKGCHADPVPPPANQTQVGR
ncbi:MAG TPA: hypothetical protein VLM89_12480 [Phycisphaerae bacterium]|nr:hypothetical protein [Phycisphaerae bacterium]